MDGETLLEALAKERVFLKLHGDKLKYRVPGGELSPQLAHQIKQAKPMLADCLAGETDFCLISPLSANQQSLFFNYQVGPESTAYDLAIGVHLSGRVDEHRLRAALVGLLTLYPCLGASYRVLTIGGRTLPCQLVGMGDVDRFELQVEMVADLDAALELAQNFYDAPLTLESSPNFFCKLINFSTSESALVLKFPHLSADGWTMGMIVSALNKLYTDSTPTEMVFPLYTDYVINQRNQEAARRASAQAYWQSQLRHIPAYTSLSESESPPLEQVTQRIPQGETQFFEISSQGRERVEVFAQQHHTTASVVLLAVMQRQLLAVNSEGVIVGVPTLGARAPGYFSSAGYFVNPVPVFAGPGRLSQTFGEHLQETATDLAGALEHRDYPFAWLVKGLGLAPDLSTTPVFQVLFNFLQREVLGNLVDWLYPWTETPSRPFLGLPTNPFPVFQQEGQFDLTLEFIDNGESYLGLLKYDPARLSEDAAGDWIDAYLAALDLALSES
ncbi:condensation domain-containing protein [Teredinibacter turnerae]|uniref:condensation domain-containing protein n=1 Tax=Teredinibacter turnerae TaxID=2426 RepID=UPI0003808CA0|nr:condensation domain-containing protein [Teredinibacter turnerae]